MVKLTDEQWERIREHFPEERRVPGRAGRDPSEPEQVKAAVSNYKGYVVPGWDVANHS